MKATSIFKKIGMIITALTAAITFIIAVIPSMSVSAAEAVTPKLSEYAVFSDRIAVRVDNASKYSSDTVFEVYVSGKYIKSVKAAKASVINIYDNGRYLKPSATYTVTVKAKGDSEAESSLTVKTAAYTYYSISKGTKLYSLVGGRMTAKSSASAKTYFKGELSTAQGKAIAGLSAAKYTGEYVYITDGSYKGYYAAVEASSRSTAVTAKRYIVSQYGKSMDGGQYVWGAASYRRTDCSGLTMQCYNQIGISISHSVRAQATLGTSVSLSSIQPGDLIILNNRSHVAMYIGDGKMVHAMNSRDGIKVESISKLRYYRLDSIRRIIV